MTHPQFTPSLHPRYPAGHLVGGKNVGGKFMPKSMSGSALWAQQVSAMIAGGPNPTPRKSTTASRLVGPTSYPFATVGRPFIGSVVPQQTKAGVISKKQWYVNDASGNMHGPFVSQSVATNYYIKLTAPPVAPASNMPSPPPPAVTVPSGANVYTTKVVKVTAAGPRNMTEHWFDYQGRTYGPYATKATMQKQLAIATKPAHPVAKGKDLIGQPPNQHPNRLATKVVRSRPVSARQAGYQAAITSGGAAYFSADAADADLRAIADLQGFSGKPEVVTKAEMSQLVKAGSHYILFRGVQGSTRAGQQHAGTHNRTAKQIQDQLRSGGAYYGVGVYGNGYYFAPDRPTAVGYSDHTPGSVVRAALPKNAKIGQYNTLNVEAGKLVKHHAANPDSQAVWADVGRYAMARGYDAIKVPAGYYVILNRSILKIQDV